MVSATSGYDLPFPTTVMPSGSRMTSVFAGTFAATVSRNSRTFSSADFVWPRPQIDRRDGHLARSRDRGSGRAKYRPTRPCPAAHSRGTVAPPLRPPSPGACVSDPDLGPFAFARRAVYVVGHRRRGRRPRYASPAARPPATIRPARPRRDSRPRSDTMRRPRRRRRAAPSRHAPPGCCSPRSPASPSWCDTAADRRTSAARSPPARSRRSSPAPRR